MDRQLLATFDHVGRTLHAMIVRLRGEVGQTAAEYIGLILLIAVVLGGIAATEIGDTIRTGIMDAIGRVFSERG